jgi:hypothetical protein
MAIFTGVKWGPGGSSLLQHRAQPLAPSRALPLAGFGLSMASNVPDEPISSFYTAWVDIGRERLQSSAQLAAVSADERIC